MTTPNTTPHDTMHGPDEPTVPSSTVALPASVPGQWPNRCGGFAPNAALGGTPTRCGFAHGHDGDCAPFDAVHYYVHAPFPPEQCTSRERYDVRQVDGNGFVAYSRGAREAERLAELLRGKLSHATLATLGQVRVSDDAPKWAREALALLDDRLRPFVVALTDPSAMGLCYDVGSGEVTALRPAGLSPKLAEQMQREITERRRADAGHVFPCLCDDCARPTSAAPVVRPTPDSAYAEHAAAWVGKADREREDELRAKYGGGAWVATTWCPKCHHLWAWRTEVANSDHADARYECGSTSCKHVWTEDGPDA